MYDDDDEKQYCAVCKQDIEYGDGDNIVHTHYDNSDSTSTHLCKKCWIKNQKKMIYVYKKSPLIVECRLKPKSNQTKLLKKVQLKDLKLPDYAKYELLLWSLEEFCPAVYKNRTLLADISLKNIEQVIFFKSNGKHSNWSARDIFIGPMIDRNSHLFIKAEIQNIKVKMDKFETHIPTLCILVDEQWGLSANDI